VDTGLGPLGILAGNGDLPLEVANAVRAQGRDVHLVAVRGEAEPGIEAHPHTWIGLGQIGGMLRAFREAGCRDLVILGGVRRPDLLKLRPDLGFFRNLPLILSLMVGGDDSVLRRVVSFFERHGFRVLGAHDVAPALLAEEGVLGGAEPGDQLRRDIALGFALIEALAPLDVGQAVVIAGGQPVAIEGAEGTDRMLARVKEMRAAGFGGQGGVIVKAPKRGQELRVDLPAVGPRTVEGAATAGLQGIAVAARQVLVARRGQVRQLSKETGLFLVGADPQAQSAAAPPRADGDTNPGRLRWISGKVKWRDIRDAERALEAMSAVGPFGAGAAAVVARQHVLAIEAGEGAERMLERVAGLRQWGDRKSRRRRGVVALRADSADAAACAQWAANSGLAGVVLAGAWPDRERSEFASAAARAKLFVLICEDHR
jgi:lipid-A-disaccharide synthase